MDPLYPAVFPGKFLYDSDRIENPDISRFFKAWILLYLASFLLGGIMSWLRLYFGKFFRIISFLFTLGICGFFLLYHGLLFLKKLWKSQDHSFDVILTVNGKDFHLKAFLDSGNHLSDPLTGNRFILSAKTPVRRFLPKSHLEDSGTSRTGLYRRRPVFFLFFLSRR